MRERGWVKEREKECVCVCEGEGGEQGVTCPEQWGRDTSPGIPWPAWPTESLGGIIKFTIKFTKRHNQIIYAAASGVRPASSTKSVGDIQGYLAHKKAPTLQDHHRALGIALL
jgi:hypothetical protein